MLDAGLAMASPLSDSDVGSDVALACGESVSLICFGVDGGTSQGVDPVDVAYAATFLRNIAKTTAGTPDAFWNSTSLILPLDAPILDWVACGSKY